MESNIVAQVFLLGPLVLCGFILIYCIIKFLKTPINERMQEANKLPIGWRIVAIIGLSIIGVLQIFFVESKAWGLASGVCWLLMACISLYGLIKDVSNKKT